MADLLWKKWPRLRSRFLIKKSIKTKKDLAKSKVFLYTV